VVIACLAGIVVVKHFCSNACISFLTSVLFTAVWNRLRSSEVSHAGYGLQPKHMCLRYCLWLAFLFLEQVFIVLCTAISETAGTDICIRTGIQRREQERKPEWSFLGFDPADFWIRRFDGMREPLEVSFFLMRCYKKCNCIKRFSFVA
jgi:hypothetical protein